MLANAFVSKAVLGLSTTAGMIERLAVDRALRRICGFPMCKELPRDCDRGSKRNAQGYKNSWNGYKLLSIQRIAVFR